MESRSLSEVLRAAIAENPYAVEFILSRYMPLINSRCRINGVIDEDLRQYIIMRIIMLNPKINPDIE